MTSTFACQSCHATGHGDPNLLLTSGWKVIRPFRLQGSTVEHHLCAYCASLSSCPDCEMPEESCACPPRRLRK